MEPQDGSSRKAVAIPPSAFRHLCMKEVDQQELWQFTLAAVEMHGHQGGIARDSGNV